MIWRVEPGFHLEELLLASGGLNLLMHEARLATEYQELKLGREKATQETTLLLKDIRRFRGEIFSTAQDIFGPPDKEPGGRP